MYKSLWDEFLDFNPWVRHGVVILGFFVCLAGASYFWWSVWFGCLILDFVGTVMKSME